jgi:hypothetical protein
VWSCHLGLPELVVKGHHIDMCLYLIEIQDAKGVSDERAVIHSHLINGVVRSVS